MSDDEAVLEFLDVMRRLQAECPWKAAQTHRSLSRYLLEETYEVLEALDTGDAELLREELGDLLLQVFFHTSIAEQDGAFTTGDVARDIIAKMVRRNRHVLGDDEERVRNADLDATAVNELWESRKAEEKQRGSVTDGLPAALPALLYADKVLDRLERAGGAPTSEGETSHVAGRNLPPRGGVGERLLALVAEARAEGVDPEQELRDAVRRLLEG